MREVKTEERKELLSRYQLPPLAPKRRNRGFPWFLLITILVLAGSSIFAVTKIWPRPEQVSPPEEVVAAPPLAIATTVSQPAEEQVRVRTEPDRAATMESRLSRGQIVPDTKPQVDAAVSVPTPVPVPWDKVESFIENNQGAGEVQEAVDVFRTSNETNRQISENVGQLMEELLRSTHYENLQYYPKLLRMAQVAEWLLNQSGIQEEFQARIEAEKSAYEKSLASRLQQPTIVPTPNPTATFPPTPTGRRILFGIPVAGLGTGFSPLSITQNLNYVLGRESSTKWRIVQISKFNIGTITFYDIELQNLATSESSWITGALWIGDLKVGDVISSDATIKIVLQSFKNRFP